MYAVGTKLRSSFTFGQGRSKESEEDINNVQKYVGEFNMTMGTGKSRIERISLDGLFTRNIESGNGYVKISRMVD